MQTLIADGDYANESEYIRDLVRKDLAKNAKYHELKTAIQLGVDSGVGDKTIPQIMKQVEDKLKTDGRL